LWLDVLWNLQVTLLSHERQEIVEIEVQVSWRCAHGGSAPRAHGGSAPPGHWLVIVQSFACTFTDQESGDESRSISFFGCIFRLCCSYDPCVVAYVVGVSLGDMNSLAAWMRSCFRSMENLCCLKTSSRMGI
jgi:hypothetical protein